MFNLSKVILTFSVLHRIKMEISMQNLHNIHVYRLPCWLEHDMYVQIKKTENKIRITNSHKTFRHC